MAEKSEMNFSTNGAGSHGVSSFSTNGYSANGHGPTGHSNNGHSASSHPVEGRSTAESSGRRYAQIVGWGYEVPEKIITNKDLEQIIETNDEWIRDRTGIEERHVVSDPKQTTATLGAAAARKALEVADVHPSKVDLIICATSSPEYIFPSTACIIQDTIGAINAGAFDLSAACSGFVYALAMARGHILAGEAEYVLVIGAETLSRLVDWTDRNTCILFGDGAGAVLVAASNVPGGILATELGSDGSGAEALYVPAGGSALPPSLETVSSGMHFMKMDGKAVFRFATRVMATATQKVVQRAGLTLDDISVIVPHQANVRIIQNSVLKQLKVPEDKVIVNVQRYGNTSTASIPIALCEALTAGRIKPGDNVVFVGFGAGLTWAACAIQWGVPVDKPVSTWWKATRWQANYQAATVRSMLKRAMRRVYAAWPGDPESVSYKEPESLVEGEWKR